MSEEQQQHLQGLLYEFGKLASNKYTQGALEHGGNLWDMSNDDLLNNAIDEAIDQVVYLLTLKQQLAKNTSKS